MSNYMNGNVGLGDVVGAYVDYNLLTDASQLSAEQLHELTGIITEARHGQHGTPLYTWETVSLANRKGVEVYRQEDLIINGQQEGEQ